MTSQLYECETCDQVANVIRATVDPQRTPVCIACGRHMVRQPGEVLVELKTDQGE